MDKEVDDATFNNSCCVSQCKSRNGKGISFFKFPRDENLREKWAEKLKIEGTVTKNLYVCNLHFRSTDFEVPAYPSVRPRVKRGVVPSLKLPKVPLKSPKSVGRRTLRLKENSTRVVRNRKTTTKAKQAQNSSTDTDDDPLSSIFDNKNNRNVSIGSRGKAVKSRKRMSKAKQTLKSSDSDDEPLTCKEILSRCVNRNETNSSSETKSSFKRKPEVSKINPVEPFVFVDVSQMAGSPKKRLVPLVEKYRPNILRRSRTATKSTSGPVINSVSRSIGVQTETNNDTESEFQKVRFSENIEFLRRNLLGHGLKINGSTFTINECSISFKNGDKDEISKLIIQPEHLISSGKILLSSLLESSESDRILKITKTPQQIPEDVPNLSQSPEPSVATEHSYTTQNDGAVKPIVPLFDKEAKVNLNRLPKELLDAFEKGHKIKVETEEFPKKGSVVRKYTIKVIKRVVRSVQCEICDKKFVDSDALKEHKKFHEDLQKTPPISQEARPRLNSIEIVEQPPTTETNQSDERNIVCDMCYRRFKHKHSFVYHRKIVHGKNEEEEPTPTKVNESAEKEQEKTTESPKVTNSIEVVEHYPENEESHLDVKQFICPLCNRRFKYYHSFNNHLRIVHHWNEESHSRNENEDGKKGTQTNKHTCPECPGTFWFAKDLDKHLLDTHQIVLKKPLYQCEICKKMFITFRSLMYHQEKSHNLKINKNIHIKYRCATCMKIFEIDYFYKSNHEKECKAKFEAERKKSNPDGDLDKRTTEVLSDKEEVTQLLETSKKENVSEKISNIGKMKHSEITEEKQKIGILEENTRKKEGEHTEDVIEAEKQLQSILEENTNTRKRKNSEEANNVGKKSKSAEESNEILEKLRNLLGSTDGPNDITIVSIDE